LGFLALGKGIDRRGRSRGEVEKITREKRGNGRTESKGKKRKKNKI